MAQSNVRVCFLARPTVVRVCAYVRVCVRVCAYVRVCACVCVCGHMYSMCILALPEDLFGLPSSLREGQQLAPLLCERLVDAELAAEAERRERLRSKLEGVSAGGFGEGLALAKPGAIGDLGDACVPKWLEDRSGIS